MIKEEDEEEEGDERICQSQEVKPFQEKPDVEKPSTSAEMPKTFKKVSSSKSNTSIGTLPGRPLRRSNASTDLTSSASGNISSQLDISKNASTWTESVSISAAHYSFRSESCSTLRFRSESYSTLRGSPSCAAAETPPEQPASFQNASAQAEKAPNLFFAEKFTVKDVLRLLKKSTEKAPGDLDESTMSSQSATSALTEEEVRREERIDHILRVVREKDFRAIEDMHRERERLRTDSEHSIYAASTRRARDEAAVEEALRRASSQGRYVAPERMYHPLVRQIHLRMLQRCPILPNSIFLRLAREAPSPPPSFEQTLHKLVMLRYEEDYGTGILPDEEEEETQTSSEETEDYA